MLERLLDLLSNGEIQSMGQLAREIGVSEALIEQMLEDLERMGYVRAVRLSGCSGDCTHCGTQTSCTTPCAYTGSGRIWARTEKPAPARH